MDFVFCCWVVVVDAVAVVEVVAVEVTVEVAVSPGRTSFFCFEAGRISSRSTGTPRETRKRRRIRDLTQFWGWRGGGATSWDQRERERSVWKMAEAFSMGWTGGREVVFLEVGKRRSRGSSRAAWRSGRDWMASKSMSGGCCRILILG